MAVLEAVVYGVTVFLVSLECLVVKGLCAEPRCSDEQKQSLYCEAGRYMTYK